METIQYGAGCNVVRMPTMNPEKFDTIFNGVEVTSSRDLNATFISTTIGGMRLVRAIHSSERCRSRRIGQHLTDPRSTYYYACVPLSGRIEIEHLGRVCTLGAGSMCFVSTEHAYSIEMSDQLDGFWLRIPADQFGSYAISINDVLSEPLDISGGIGLAARELLASSMSIAGQVSQRGDKLISQSMLGFLGDLIDSSRPAAMAYSSTYRRKIFARAREFIEEHLDDESLDPQMVANGIGISRRYLSQIFAAEGSSVMRWVQRRRLERCRLALQANLIELKTIQEIAYSVGFANISSFNRAFKAQFGCSPRAMMDARPAGAIGQA